MQFVYLQGEDFSITARQQCRDDPGIHVVAALIRGDGILTAQRIRQHAGGGGLSVRAGDQHSRAIVGKIVHDVRVDLVREQTADHATRSPAGCARGYRRQASDGCGHPRAGTGHDGHRR